MAQEQIGEIAQLLRLHIKASESNALLNEKNHDKTFAKLEEQDKVAQAILLQAKETNGRVKSLEKTREENEKKFELVDSIISERRTIKIVVSICLIVGGTMATMAILNIKSSISSSIKEDLATIIEQKLDERVSGVYLDNR